MPDLASPGSALPHSRLASPGPRGGSREVAVLVAILVVTAAVQLWFALGKGLMLDEFHTHFHATQTAWPEFLPKLLQDNHPPISFLLIRVFAWALGDTEFAVRLPSMLFALVEIALVWRMARDYGRGAAWCAAAVLAASSLHLDLATQARMYSLHSLAVTGCCFALLRILDGNGSQKARIALCAWLWIGAHNHYFFLQYAFGMALTAMLIAIMIPTARPRLKRLFLPVAIAIVLSLPWYLLGFRIQLEHGLPPGGKAGGLLSLLESFVHLFFLNVRLGESVPIVGGFLREIFILGGAALTILGLYGAWWGLKPVQPARVRTATVTMVCVGFGVPCLAAALVFLLPRSGFTWHYISPSSAALAWLIAMSWSCGESRIVRPVLLLSLSAAVALSLMKAASRGTEDYSGAVARVLEQHQPGDRIVSVEWQPVLFPQGRPWDYYAPRLHPNPPKRMAMNDSFFLRNPELLQRGGRVFVLRTSLPGGQALMRLLKRRGYKEVGRESFGYGVDVLIYE